MKVPLYIVLGFEFGLAVFLTANTCLLRPAFFAAARAVQEHPAAATALAEFRRQQILDEVQPFIFGMILFGTFALPTLLLAFLTRQRLPRPSHPTPTGVKL